MRIVVNMALAAAMVLATVGAASAQDTIAARRALMKGNGAAAGQLNKIAKGEEPYDAAKVQTALDQLDKTGKEFIANFPKGTETGGDSIASPKIWEDPAGFQEQVAKFQAAVVVAKAAPKDVDGVKAALAALGPTCQSCHTGYRLRR